MSPRMASIEAEGFSEIPPESNVIPFPTKIIGWDSSVQPGLRVSDADNFVVTTQISSSTRDLPCVADLQKFRRFVRAFRDAEKRSHVLRFDPRLVANIHRDGALTNCNATFNLRVRR